MDELPLPVTAQADPKLCWNCGKRGAPGIGSQMRCPACEVTWMPWARLVTAKGTARGA